MSVLQRATCLLVALVLAGFTRATNRLAVYGAAPRGRRSLLVVANHAHDLDGALVPPRLFLADPRRARVRAVAAQRLFEPGHLARLGPSWMRPILHRFNVGPAISYLGALPLENDPRHRVLRSVAWEALHRHGNLTWGEVFTDDAIRRLESRLAARRGRGAAGGARHPDGEPGSRGAPGPRGESRPGIARLRMRDAFGMRLGTIADELVAISEMRQPHRREFRTASGPRVERQLQAIRAALARGDTLYVTPEGELTPTGEVLRLRDLARELLPLAGSVVFAATAYDVFEPGRLGVHLRWVEAGEAAAGAGRPATERAAARADEVEALRLRLAAARPVTMSQIVAAAIVDAGGAIGEEEWLDACLAVARSLPEGAFAVPAVRDLAADAPGARVLSRLRRMFALMAARGFVIREGSRSVRRLGAVDPRFPHVPDMVAYQAAMLRQTVEACRAQML